jgi:hypothetical protein
VSAETLIVGRLSATGSPTNANLVTFDKGAFDVNSLQLGVNAANAAAAGAQGTFTLGTVGADPLTQGTLTVNNSFFLGNDTNASAATPTKAIFTINNGTANIKTDIQVVTNDSVADLANDVSTINLNAGTLNMNGHNIGTFASPVKTINLAGGTLSNGGQIAGNTITITGTPTLSGRLVLASGGTASKAVQPPASAQSTAASSLDRDRRSPPARSPRPARSPSPTICPSTTARLWP